MSFKLPLPIGVTSRSLPDRYAHLLTGGASVISAVSGQVSYCGVYNNATDGTDLWVYLLDVVCTVSTFVVFEWISGNPGTIDPTIGVPSAIDPRIHKTPGQVFNLTTAVCIGTHMGGINMFANTPRTYAPGFPIAIIPPTYSFMLQTYNPNVAMEVGFTWLPVPGPLTQRV